VHSRKGAARRPQKKAAAASPRAGSGPLILDLSVILAWRMRRQVLEKPLLRAPSNLSISLARTGWMASPSSWAPYLGLAARYASFGPQDLDLALTEEGVLLEVPAVRGRRMLVPVEDGWIALQAYRRAAQPQVDEMVRRRRIVTRAELENLGDVIRAVLAGRDLTCDEIEEKVPQRLVRDLGDKSRSQGFGTTVSLGLWTLMARGDVLARHSAGRPAGARMKYVLRKDLLGPVEATDLRPRQWQECLAALTLRYFTWTGLARLGDFAWWAGLAQAEARRGIRGAGLVPVKVKGFTSDWYAGPEELEDLCSFRPPEPSGVALIPSGDCLSAPWKSLDALVDPVDVTRFAAGPRKRRLRSDSAAGKLDGDRHFIVIGGRLAGVWEWCPDGGLRYATFAPLPKSIDQRVARRAARMEEFIAKELGRKSAGQAFENVSLEPAVGEVIVQ
ncbi:MAG: DNA glycosylase AlkZ-like family protein, partial [Acidobacteriota bacterium]